MKLYLVRHADAVEKKQDPRRPLSASGVKASKQLGRYLKADHVRLGAIWHSPKTRSVQTAKLVSLYVPPEKGLVQRADIKPMSRTGGVAWDLEKVKHDVMLVGHLPHMAKLAARRPRWKKARSLMDFPKPSLIVLERLEDGHWRLCLMLGPHAFRVILKQPQ